MIAVPVRVSPVNVIAADQRVAGEKLAGGIGSESVDDVVHALRYADLVHDFAEQRRRRRGFLGRLDDDRVAAGEGGTDLPRHQQERQIPRRDDCDHALRHADRIIQRRAAVRRRHLERLGRHVLHHVGEDLEIRRAARDVDVLRQRVRLAGVGDFGVQELGEAPIDLVGHRVHEFAALRDVHAAPRPVERRVRGLHRGVDLRLARLGHHADQPIVHRRPVLESLARLRGDIFAVDEIEDLLLRHGEFSGSRFRRGPRWRMPTAPRRPLLPFRPRASRCWREARRRDWRPTVP